MKDAVIFHPARTIGETAGAAVEMGQNELATEYTESAHPYKQLAEVLHIADETKNRTGYVLFPKVTKFNTWLLSRYGKRLEAGKGNPYSDGEANRAHISRKRFSGIAWLPSLYLSI